MAEEEKGEVWEEIRDFLHRLTEQGERQTELLEKIAKQSRIRASQAFAMSILIASLGFFALIFGLPLPGGPITEKTGFQLLLVMTLFSCFFMLMSVSHVLARDLTDMLDFLRALLGRLRRWRRR